MSTEQALPPGNPMLVAFEQYRATEEYQSAHRWAQVPEHTQGALWAAFVRGWLVATSLVPRFGPTGQFPHPPVSDDDEGEITIGTRYDPINGLVEIALGKPVAWLGLTPELARTVGQSLIDHSEKRP